MLKYEVKNQQGEVVGEQELSPAVFGVKVNESLVHQAVVTQMANQRQVLAHTKTRSEVRGGGRKPWRQKGTGRARAGSIRSPIWIGGGVTFGPRKDRSFSKKINIKMRKKAILMVLSDKVENKLMVLMDKLELEKPRTRLANEIINKIIGDSGKQKTEDKKGKTKKKKTKKSVLIVIEKKDEDLKRAFNNLSDVELMNLNNINVVDLLKYKNMVITVNAVKKLEARYGSN